MATSKSVRLKVFTKAVKYRWSLPDGTVCHGSTVVLARRRSELPAAVARFWHDNTHVEEVGK